MSVSPPELSAELVAAVSALDRGDNAEVRASLARANATGATGRRPEGVRWAWLAAQLARREGDAVAAQAHLRAASARVDRGTPPAWVAAVHHLAADLALSRGAYDRARTLLRAGLADPAVAAAPEGRVLFLRSLGALETRLGRPRLGAQAYRDALDALGSAATSSATAALESNLAMALHMAGDRAAAWAAVERATALREQPGVPVRDRGNTAALRALLLADAGAPDAADAWQRALDLATRCGDAALTAEIQLRAALYRLDVAADPQAAALADVAQWVAAGLRLQEPTLVGLAHEVAAALAQARGDRAGARRAARAARAAFAEVHAAYHVARMDAWLARSAQAAGDSAAFHDRWHLATAAANAGGFRLPRGTDALAAGVTRPTSSTARYALRLGLVAAEHGLGVVVHVAEGWVERGGHRVDLGPGSVTLRVLLAIVGAGRSGVTAAALSEAVWGLDVPAGRLRFQLHRLRAALGEGDAPLVAQRRGRHLVYRWNAAIPVRLRGRSARPQ